MKMKKVEKKNNWIYRTKKSLNHCHTNSSSSGSNNNNIITPLRHLQIIQRCWKHFSCAFFLIQFFFITSHFFCVCCLFVSRDCIYNFTGKIKFPTIPQSLARIIKPSEKERWKKQIRNFSVWKKKLERKSLF